VQPVQRSSNQLVFLSPSVDQSVASGDGRFPAVVYNVSFAVDAVASVRRTFAVFRVLPNPRLTPFKDGKKKYRGEILSLQVSCVSINLTSLYY